MEEQGAGEVVSTAESVTNTVEYLCSDHHGWLHGWLRSKFCNDCDAADITQDFFVRLLTHRNMGKERQPRVYLCKIARSIMIDK